MIFCAYFCSKYIHDNEIIDISGSDINKDAAKLLFLLSSLTAKIIKELVNILTKYSITI